MTADVVAGAALVPVAAVSLGRVRHRRELPFAALPAVFAVHQLIESLVWAREDGHVTAAVAHAAAVAYVFIALPLLPTLFPVAVMLLEPLPERHRALPFVGLGVIVSARLGYSMLTHGVGVTLHEHAVSYGIGMTDGVAWAALYIVAIIGASVVSTHREVVAFGVVNLVGLTVVALAYAQAFASLWCVYAAASSLLVALHMVRRHPRVDRSSPMRVSRPT